MFWGPLNSKLILNDQWGHSDLIQINVVSFRTFRGPLFLHILQILAVYWIFDWFLHRPGKKRMTVLEFYTQNIHEIYKNKMLNLFFRYQSHFANLAWIIPMVITLWICTIITIMALSHPKGDLKSTSTPPEVSKYFEIKELQALAHLFNLGNLVMAKKCKSYFNYDYGKIEYM